MKRFALMVGLLLVSAQAFAADKAAVIREIMSSDYVERSFDLDGTNKKMRATIKLAYQAKEKKAPSDLDKFEFFTRDDVERIKVEMAKVLDETFTEEELVAMRDFNLSDIGKSINKKTPSMLSKMMPMIVGLSAQKQFEIKTKFPDLD